MDIDLKGKNVVVTGCGGAIGKEMCAAFINCGANVIGADIADLDGIGFPCYKMDLASPESIEQACCNILNDYPKIDVLVNNAAIYAGIKVGPMEEIDLSEWDFVMNVNVRGLYLTIKGLLPGLKAATGKIINFASGSVLKGGPFMLHYVSSKGAVVGMTRALATELGAHGITVNAVTPGLVDTPSSRETFPGYQEKLNMFVGSQAIKKPVQSKDIAGTVLYLASSWADAVTGQLCLVDRGAIMH